MIDLVTVIYNQQTFDLAYQLEHDLLKQHQAAPRFNFIIEDNRPKNRGFAIACNAGARRGEAPIIGFINPDAVVRGDCLQPVLDTFAADPLVAVTGCRFGKPDDILREWGLRQWVCGAAFFVRRFWFESQNGFDEQFVWAWEETDFCRRTEAAGLIVKPIDLPIRHESPTDETITVAEYKRYHLRRGWKLYQKKWNVEPTNQ